MGTKRTPRMRGRHAIELTPALEHFLMCGCSENRFAPARLPGWTAAHLEIAPDADALTTHWLTHRAGLIAEARKNGFTPAAADWFDGDRLKKNATDVATGLSAARERWSKEFCSTFGY